MTSLSPIVLFTYNRPNHTRQTLQALSASNLAAQSELYIFADGPKVDCTAENLEKIKMTRAVLREKSWCGKVHIIESEKNKGLAASIIAGVTEIVNKHGTVIVLEDDIVVGKHFLEFMNEALERYKEDKDVWHITGFRAPIKTKNPNGCFFYPVMDCWGWATWADRWRYFEKDTDKLLDVFTEEMKYRFNLNGADDGMFSQIELNKEGKINTWAIYWYTTIFLKNGLCLSPNKSLAKNIGFDGTGVHCGANPAEEIHDSIDHKVTDWPKVIAVDEKEYREQVKFYKDQTKNHVSVKTLLYKCTPPHCGNSLENYTVQFSIVVPVHNREKTLKMCIDSILAQTYSNFELILVDDHSTDDSVKIIKEYQKKDSRIILIEQPNEKHGAQAARNAGIKVAKYNWIMFNDSDDAWTPDKIQQEYEILKRENFSDDLCIYSNCIVHNIKDNSEKFWDLPLITKENSYKDLLSTSGPMFQSLVCSKKYLDEAGWLDEDVPAYQEWDASLSLAKNGRFIKINEPLFTYYVGSEDAISKSVKKELLGRHYIYSKYKNDIITELGIENYKNRYENLFRYFIDNYSSFLDWKNDILLCDFLNVCLVELGKGLLEREKVDDISGKRLIKLLVKKTFLYRGLRKLKHMHREGGGRKSL